LGGLGARELREAFLETAALLWCEGPMLGVDLAGVFEPLCGPFVLAEPQERQPPIDPVARALPGGEIAHVVFSRGQRLGDLEVAPVVVGHLGLADVGQLGAGDSAERDRRPPELSSAVHDYFTSPRA